jgi:hypothetical protein
MTIRSILAYSILAVVFCFVVVWMFTQPTIFSGFDLTSPSKANIGSVIGGITAPVFGLLSTVLLIITLNKQIESIKEQKLKNESDLIHSLIIQMENELQNVYYKYNEEKTEGNERNKTTHRFSGVEAINEFTHRFRYEFIKNKWDFTFRQFYQAHQILLIVRSYKLIVEKIESSALLEDTRLLFIQKVNAFYECRLYFPLKKISEGVEMSPHFRDQVTNELQEFYLEMEAKSPTLIEEQDV